MVEQKCVTGGFGSETLRFYAVNVRYDCNAWNPRDRSMQFGIRPTGAGVCRCVKQNNDAHLVLSLRGDLRQLINAGFRARALRVRHHDQRRTIVRGLDRGICWPGTWHSPHISCRAFVRE